MWHCNVALRQRRRCQRYNGRYKVATAAILHVISCIHSCLDKELVREITGIHVFCTSHANILTRNTLHCDQSNVYSSRVVSSAISQDQFFQDGRRPPSWIWSNRKWRRWIRRPRKPHPRLEPNMKGIGWRVAELWPFEIFAKCVNGPWVVGRSVVNTHTSYTDLILLFRYVRDVARKE